MQSKIAQVRGKLKHTQAQFAALLGVTQATVSLWEKNMAMPSPVILKKLLDLAKSYKIEITPEDIINMRSTPRNRSKSKKK